jgi:excisionase family DNA binding protein
MKPILSPRDLAAAIGVSESSIKRWVDDGVIHATKTAGGHRRIHAAEAIRFIRESHSILLKPELLGLSDVARLGGDYPGYGEEADAFFDFVRAGASEEARGLLLSLYLSGQSVAQIVDGPLRVAMERIGELWLEDPSGIFWEHRATDIAIQAVSRLRSILPQAVAGPLAVGGAPAGDRYILPSLSVAVVLESEGHRTVNLGPETPLDTLQVAVERLDATLVWLSVSVAEALDRLNRELGKLVQELSRNRIPLVLGGSAAHALEAPKSDYFYRGSSMAELEALVKGMRLRAPTTRAGE